MPGSGSWALDRLTASQVKLFVPIEHVNHQCWFAIIAVNEHYLNIAGYFRSFAFSAIYSIRRPTCLINGRLSRRARFPPFVYPHPLVRVFPDQLFDFRRKPICRLINILLTVTGV